MKLSSTSVSQKIISGVILFSFLFSFFGTVFYPSQTNAQLGGAIGGLAGDLTGCAANVAISGIGGFVLEPLFATATDALINQLPSSFQGFFTSQDEVPTKDREQRTRLLEQKIKEFALDCTVWAITKTIINEIVATSIAWLQTGLGGYPYWVLNSPSFFAGLEDRTVAEFFASAYDASGICLDFKPNIQFLIQGSRTRIPFITRSSCTIENIVNPNIFYQNYSAGGLDALAEYAANPYNSPYGTLSKTSEEIDRRIALITESYEQELEQGSGFLSAKDEAGDVATPSKIIEVQGNNILGSGLQVIINADEFEEAVSSWLTRGVQSIFSSGSSLRNLEGGDSSGSGN